MYVVIFFAVSLSIAWTRVTVCFTESPPAGSALPRFTFFIGILRAISRPRSTSHAASSLYSSVVWISIVLALRSYSISTLTPLKS